MTSNPRSPRHIERLDQIRALIAPTRQEIVDALEIVGPAPVAAIAGVLGRAPDSLYHHIRVLVGVGLVREVETRVRGRVREAVYELAGHDMTIGYDLADAAKREALNALVRGMSRIARRDFERASEKGEAVVEGPRRNLRGARMVGLLDGEQLEELGRLYARIAAIMASPPRERTRAEFHAVTYLISPLDRRQHADAGDSS
jgi:DNA-binding transcriptional ArsR family regulator